MYRHTYIYIYAIQLPFTMTTMWEPFHDMAGVVKRGPSSRLMLKLCEFPTHL